MSAGIAKRGAVIENEGSALYSSVASFPCQKDFKISTKEGAMTGAFAS
jgi:hypothetical protein